MAVLGACLTLTPPHTLGGGARNGGSGNALFAHRFCRVGVELDEAKGNNNGKVRGHKYFTCPDKKGLLVQPNRVGEPSAPAAPVATVVAAVAAAAAPPTPAGASLSTSASTTVDSSSTGSDSSDSSESSESSDSSDDDGEAAEVAVAASEVEASQPSLKRKKEQKGKGDQKRSEVGAAAENRGGGGQLKQAIASKATLVALGIPVPPELTAKIEKIERDNKAAAEQLAQAIASKVTLVALGIPIPSELTAKIETLQATTAVTANGPASKKAKTSKKVH